jgi:WhiB family redox-sensing transcriptional regulator
MCRGLDPDIFYPVKGDTVWAQQAKDICHTCGVEAECLEHVLELDRNELGVWGGTTERERRVVRRRRKLGSNQT